MTQRKFSRLKRKHPGSHSRKSSTSTEAKMSKLVKSSSPREKSKLETLYSHNSSSKMSFWVSPDLSLGIEQLFNAMNLCENSKRLIISINLWNIKNMIQLSNLDLDEITRFFKQRLTGFKFPRHNHQGLMLRKVILNLIKDNHGFHEDDVIV
jgi:hypothetical protein